MRKLIIVLFTFVLFINVNALESKDNIIKEINNSSIYTNEVIDIFINLSNKYKNDFNKAFDSSLTNSFTTDIDKDISLVINKLSGNAKSDLSSNKKTLVTKIKYIKKSFEDASEFLLTNKKNLTLGDNGEVLLAIKNYLNNTKSKASSLINIYSNLIYNDIITSIDSFTSVSLLNSYYNEQLLRLYGVINAFSADLIDYETIYNEFNLKDYGFDSYFNTYLNNIQNNLDIFYSKYESKLTKLLNSDINKIVNNTNLKDTESISNRNKSIYDLIDLLSTYKTNITNSYTNIKSKIIITSITNIIKSNETNITKCLNNKIKSLKNYLLNSDTILKLKDKYESLYTINSNKKYIKYTGLINNFINGLSTTYGSINLSNLYENKVGTKSKISVVYKNNILLEYSIVIGGDVFIDGKISSLDYASIKNHIMNKQVLTDSLIVLAADINNDSKITALDYVSVKNIIMEAK